MRPADRIDEISQATSTCDWLHSWQVVKDISDQMYHYKHGDRGRNTWQGDQRGGWGEPYHYDAEGFVEALGVLTMT